MPPGVVGISDGGMETLLVGVGLVVGGTGVFEGTGVLVGTTVGCGVLVGSGVGVSVGVGVTSLQSSAGAYFFEKNLSKVSSHRLQYFSDSLQSLIFTISGGIVNSCGAVFFRA